MLRSYIYFYLYQADYRPIILIEHSATQTMGLGKAVEQIVIILSDPRASSTGVAAHWSSVRRR
jgi:hypothetical protein